MTVAAVITPSGDLVVACPYCRRRHTHGTGGAPVVVGDRFERSSHCLGGARPYTLEAVRLAVEAA